MLEILEANTLKEYPRYPGPRPGEFQMPSKFFILNAAAIFCEVFKVFYFFFETGLFKSTETA